jgi:hypothetical protein
MLNAHPNTQARPGRLAPAVAEGVNGPVGGPTTDDYPGLVGRLFVLNHVGDRDYSFAASAMRSSSCSAVSWSSTISCRSGASRSPPCQRRADRAASDRGPTLIRARGETLTGRRVDLEFALAPLLRRRPAPRRFLGLCQTMTPKTCCRPAASPPASPGDLPACPHPSSQPSGSSAPDDPKAARRPTACRASTPSWPKRSPAPRDPIDARRETGPVKRQAGTKPSQSPVARACKPFLR